MAKIVGSLWKNSKTGDNFPVATGVIEQVIGHPIKVALFKNKKKVAGSRQPDFSIVLSEPRKEDGVKVTTEKVQSSSEL